MSEYIDLLAAALNKVEGGTITVKRSGATTLLLCFSREGTVTDRALTVRVGDEFSFAGVEYRLLSIHHQKSGTSSEDKNRVAGVIAVLNAETADN